MELLNDLNLSLNTFLTNVWATGVKINEYAEKRKSSCCINQVLHHLCVVRWLRVACSFVCLTGKKYGKLRFNLNKIKRGQEFVFLLILETFRFYDMDDCENDIFSILSDARA